MAFLAGCLIPEVVSLQDDPIEGAAAQVVEATPVPVFDTGCGGTEEVPYNGIDDDCDASTPDDDIDGDGAPLKADCDDSDSRRHPMASELCDLIDNNCDGRVDETRWTWYVDADNDGFGDRARPRRVPRHP